MAGAAIVLEADALSRSYGPLVALRELSLTIVAGECVALIGANGSAGPRPSG